MTKLLVLHHSAWGHVEQMAQAVAEGARQGDGVDVTLKRVPELVPADVTEREGYKIDQAASVAVPGELADDDAIVFGTSSRFGNMAAQMRSSLDRTGGLWETHALVGKVGSVFVGTGMQHGGVQSRPAGGLIRRRPRCQNASWHHARQPPARCVPWIARRR